MTDFNIVNFIKNNILPWLIAIVLFYASICYMKANTLQHENSQLQSSLAASQSEIIALETSLKSISYQMEAKANLNSKLISELYLAEMKLHQVVITGGSSL
jgi:uncharacterized protein YlxW (UPF0749 family)